MEFIFILRRGTQTAFNQNEIFQEQGYCFSPFPKDAIIPRNAVCYCVIELVARVMI